MIRWDALAKLWMRGSEPSHNQIVAYLEDKCVGFYSINGCELPVRR